MNKIKILICSAIGLISSSIIVGPSINITKIQKSNYKDEINLLNKEFSKSKDQLGLEPFERSIDMGVALDYGKEGTYKSLSGKVEGTHNSYAFKRFQIKDYTKYREISNMAVLVLEITELTYWIMEGGLFRIWYEHELIEDNINNGNNVGIIPVWFDNYGSSMWQSWTRKINLFNYFSFKGYQWSEDDRYVWADPSWQTKPKGDYYMVIENDADKSTLTFDLVFDHNLVNNWGGKYFGQLGDFAFTMKGYYYA